ncbi:MAG TPA: carbon starvation CstA family protein [Candidatus Polarisedimenticolaceae bacterium]|nr:carbon starvation CstA family protein [Candidatus Polarisedimenticolaceae bacterium]
MTWLRRTLWAAVAVLGAFSFGMIAIVRHEPVSAGHLLVAAVCCYLIGYRFYSKFIAAKVLALNDRRTTPAVRLADGRDFVPTHRWVVFGHHFAAIAGPGPLLGPTLAAQFGYLPGTIWILAGVLLGGAVQDFVILAASLRRDGRSLARMTRDVLGPWGAAAGTLGIVLIMIILIAVLALVVVNLLAESPWGLFTCAATIPIAMLMGGVMRGHGQSTPRVAIATAIGVGLLAVALLAGHGVAAHATWGPAFTLGRVPLAWAVIAYGLAASILPIWLLLAPRDYLSTFVKLGTIGLLAVGIAWVRPELKLPAVTVFASGTGPLFGGRVFPFCFITIACGAVSGFHALVASGTTPKLLTRETDARMVGYGSMLLESFVAIMAMIAAASLPPGQYFAINSRMTPEWITSQGFPVTAAEMQALAAHVGEATLTARTGGSASLAVGMASIFHGVFGGDRAAALWYHFAVMFEVLFILTTLDAGTRAGRYLLQDALARASPRLAGSSWAANVATSAAFVAAWGYFLRAGVDDPKGGIRALWPLFGLSNQLLAATALAVATTILVRTGRARYAWVTAVPLAFLLIVTMTAGVELIGSSDPALGFLAKAAHPGTDARDAWNARLDAVVAAVFLVLVATVVLSAARQWRRVALGLVPVEPDAAPEGGGAAFGEIPPVGGRTRCC